MTDTAAAVPVGGPSSMRSDADRHAAPASDRNRSSTAEDAWAPSGWDTPRIIRLVTSIVTLVVVTVVLMQVVHLNPIIPKADLIFDNTTPTGGDMGAHVWSPAYLRDHLLPNWQLSGWSMDWYRGLPVYRFYMVIPALMIVLLDIVLPYYVAFKIVAVLGVLTFPLCCWKFGRLARFRFPMPELFAIAGMIFLLDDSFSIYGGNVLSTMAGEFSFSIALSFGVLGLGYLANGLRTGKYRVRAAVLLALACVSHGIVAIFMGMAAFIFVIVWLLGTLDWRRLRWGVGVGIFTLLLAAFWIGPFLGNHEYMTDMKYGGKPEGANESFFDMYFPLTEALDWLVMGLAVIGSIGLILRRHLTGIALVVYGIALAVTVYYAKDSLPIIGLLWNPRVLPFLYLVRYMLMMVGIYELITQAVNMGREMAARRPMSSGTGAATVGVTGLVVLGVFAMLFQVMPGAGRVEVHGESVYSWGPIHLTKAQTDNQSRADLWASYNFQGYQGRPQYPTYYDVVQEMGAIGRERGCGTALWENAGSADTGDNGEYGTTMALMLLPFWTDSCIGSSEGLYFEASGTTPYHFLTTAAMSLKSSNPVRELNYVNNDASVGVPMLQKLGISYVMVRTDGAKAQADEQPELELLAEVPPWKIYAVADADVVVPLEVQPVVVNERSGDQRERHLEIGTSWFQNPDDWAAVPADGGPDEWQRIDVEVRPGTDTTRVDVVQPVQDIDPVELDPVTVSNVEINEQDLSFDVDEVGVPILVKVSYFPNWEVDGADGPYRVAPNFMVVIPTENHVTMSYGRSTADIAFYLMTGIGILGLIGMFVFRRNGTGFASLVTPEGRPWCDEVDDGRWSPFVRRDEVVGPGPGRSGGPFGPAPGVDEYRSSGEAWRDDHGWRDQPTTPVKPVGDAVWGPNAGAAPTPAPASAPVSAPADVGLGHPAPDATGPGEMFAATGSDDDTPTAIAADPATDPVVERVTDRDDTPDARSDLMAGPAADPTAERDADHDVDHDVDDTDHDVDHGAAGGADLLPAVVEPDDRALPAASGPLTAESDEPHGATGSEESTWSEWADELDNEAGDQPASSTDLAVIGDDEPRALGSGADDADDGPAGDDDTTTGNDPATDRPGDAGEARQ